MRGDSLFIPEQHIEGPNYGYDTDWGNKLSVYSGMGRFSGDSLFFKGSYAHHNDYTLHKVWGKKK